MIEWSIKIYFNRVTFCEGNGLEIQFKEKNKMMQKTYYQRLCIVLSRWWYISNHCGSAFTSDTQHWHRSVISKCKYLKMS